MAGLQKKGEHHRSNKTKIKKGNKWQNIIATIVSWKLRGGRRRNCLQDRCLAQVRRWSTNCKQQRINFEEAERTASRKKRKGRVVKEVP